MQKIRIDFDNPGLPQHISAVENDSQSRFFQATLYENGKAYTAPAGASYSIMYRGFGPQNQGWYDTINDGAGKRAACKVSGNVVTCEIARQALQVPGHVSIVLCVTTGKGYMLKSWPIECDCKNDRYDSTAEIQSFFYITQVSNADWNRAIQALEELKNTIDPTLSLSGKAADAKAAGNAIKTEKSRATNAETALDNKKADKTDLDVERKRIDVLNEGGLNLKDEVIDTSIKAWLAEHPEATTTVQDGAITEIKINSDFLPYIKNEYITPEMFGAIGNGVTDDTNAIKSTFKYMKEHGYTNLFLTGKYRVTQKVQVVIQQIKITGINTDPACIFCDGPNASIEIGDGDTKLYAIIMRDFWIKGSHSNLNALITFRSCWNCYFTNFHVSDGGENQYQIHITDKSGILFFNNCTIEGGSNVAELPANRNGILVESNGSILSFNGGNVWNLNTFIKFNDATNKFNLENCWIECIRELCIYDLANATESRYIDTYINNNAISIHNYKNITYTYFTFLQFNDVSTSNYTKSNINITNNKIYILDATIKNNSLVDFAGEMKAGGTAHITYENNVFSGKTLEQLQAYVFKNNLNVTSSEVSIDAIKLINADGKRLSDDKKFVNNIYYDTDGKTLRALNGVNVNNAGTDAGLIAYFDDNFYFKFKDKQGLIRQTEYTTITLSADTGFSEVSPYPPGFNAANTTVLAIKVRFESGRIGTNVTNSTNATALYVETQANGVAAYNNDPALYGKSVIVLMSKIY